MTTVMENVRTTNDRCYVGMTREQALEEGRKTVKWFSKLDTDKDGTLSFDEVMKQRTRKKNKMAVTSGAIGALTLWYIKNSPFSNANAEYVYRQLAEQESPFAKIYGSPKGYIKHAWISNALWLGLTAWKTINTMKLDKQNKAYRAQFGEENSQKGQVIKTTDDRCFVGMTKAQAKEEGRKTAKLFAELNTDNDEVLSFEEVMAQRQQREKKIKTGGNIWGGIAISQCIGGMSLERQASASYASRIVQLLITMTLAGIAIEKRLKVQKWKKQDAEYYTQHQELLKQQEQDIKAKQTEKEIEQIQEIQQVDEEQHEIETAA